MHSSAWMNGQYHPQVGQPSQTSQATHQLIQAVNTMRNQKAASSNNSSQYTPVRASVPQPQSVYFTSCNGAYSNGQTSNRQASTVPQQAVSSQQAPAGRTYRNCLLWNLKFRNATHQTACINAQSGNPPVPRVVNYVPQVTTQEVFHQNSQNSPKQSSPNMMQANAPFLWQIIPSNQNQQNPMYGKQSMVRQDTNFAVDGLQHDRVQKTLFQSANRESVQSLSTASSLQHAQMPCTSTSVSATTHNKQTAHNQNRSSGCRLNSTQHGLSLHTAPPSWMSISQPFRNNSHGITTNSLSGQSVMGQKTENNGREATLSSNSQSNPHNSQYEASLYFTKKTNGCPINSAADTGQHILNWQMMPGNADNLCQSQTAGSDHHHLANNNNTTHSGKILQFICGDRMTESSQTVRPVASSVIESCNSNTSHSSIQALPKPTHGAVSSTQHNLEAQPQPCSVPKGFYVTVTEDGSGNGFKADSIVFLGDKMDNTVLKAALHASISNDASQLQQLPERISLQRNETQSSVANNAELPEMPVSSVKRNGSSDHTSPGRAGHKAVAVVQPLSQEHYQAAHKQAFSERSNHQCKRTARDEFVGNPEKFFISKAFAKHNKSIDLTDGSTSLKDDYRVHPEVSNETISNASLNRDSGPSSGGTSSDSAEPEDSSQNHSYADDTESQQSNKMQSEQCVTPTAQQSQTTKVPVSRNSEMSKCETPKDPNASVSMLSSVPIIPWTLDKLTMLVEECIKVQMQSEDFPVIDITKKLLSSFWEDDGKKFSLLSTGYNSLIAEVEEFCSKHTKADSVILSHIQRRSCELKSCHVLKHDYVHSKIPYMSSWLNINEQLDDIDKEFGFPWPLKYCLHKLESDSQPKLIGTVNGIPSEIVSEMQNEALPQTEIKTSESDDEKQASGVADTFTQTPFPKNTATTDSSDPYSFEIQVLPPDEAKIIFDQVQSEMLKSEKTDIQMDKFMNGSVEDELPEVIDVKSSEVKLDNREQSPIEEFCCITKWMEMVCGSDNLSQSKCQCKQKPSPKDFTVKSLDEAEKTLQKVKLCVIRSDGECDPTMESKKKANADKTMDNQILTFRWPEQCTKISEIIDLTEDGDNIPHSYANIEPKNISLPSVGSCPSNSSVISEKQSENLSSSKSEITIQLSDLEEDCERAQLKPTDSSQSSSSVISEKNLSSSESEIVIRTSDLEEDYGQAQMKPTGPAESFESKQTSTDKTDKVRFFVSSSLGQENLHSSVLKTTFSLDSKHKSDGRKPKRLKSPDRISLSLKKRRKCKGPVDADLQTALEDISEHMKTVFDPNDFEAVATNVRSVKLSLFGSSSQRKYVSIGCGMNHMTSPENSSNQVPMPPETLTVNVNSWQRRPSETAPALERSAKQGIYEEWRQSFVPTKMKHGRKFLIPKCALDSVTDVCHKRPKSVGNNTARKPLAEPKITKWALNWRAKLKIQKSKEDVVTPKQPADDMKSKAEIGDHAVMPLKENNVLKFSVLPNTFNFKDGNEARDSVLGKTDLVEVKDSQIAVKTPRGAWTPHPEKKYCPLPRSNISPSLFHEFQKKYMEKTEPSMDQ